MFGSWPKSAGNSSCTKDTGALEHCKSEFDPLLDGFLSRPRLARNESETHDNEVHIRAKMTTRVHSHLASPATQ